MLSLPELRHVGTEVGQKLDGLLLSHLGVLGQGRDCLWQVSHIVGVVRQDRRILPPVIMMPATLVTT